LQSCSRTPRQFGREKSTVIWAFAKIADSPESVPSNGWTAHLDDPDLRIFEYTLSASA
jgi:hypothetical protein